MLAALVLAAGASSRFGRRDKLAERLAGLALLDHAVARARESGAVRVLVVDRRMGPGRVRAGDAALGLGASLAAGLRALRPVEREVLLFLADMPFARAPWRLRLRAGVDAVRPWVAGVPGHPLLVRSTVARATARPGARGLGAGLARTAGVRGRAGNAIDVDTVATLRKLRRRIAGAGGAFRLLEQERPCFPKPHNGLPRSRR